MMTERLASGARPSGSVLRYEPEDFVIQTLNLCREYSTPYGAVSVLRGIDLTVAQGSLVAITGSSGSGKSTLLTILAGIDRTTSGEVAVLGHCLTEMSERQRSHLRLHQIGVVFQDHNLISNLTAAENIELILRETQPRNADIAAMAQASLTEVGLAGLGQRFPHELSGGQQQRVGIARAISGEKRLLLADEPTGALDHDNSVKLFELFATLVESHGLTIVLCTHDLLTLAVAHAAYDLKNGVLEAR